MGGITFFVDVIKGRVLIADHHFQELLSQFAGELVVAHGEIDQSRIGATGIQTRSFDTEIFGESLQ